MTISDNITIDRREKFSFLFPAFLLFSLLLIYPNRSLIVAPHWITFAFSTASISLFCAGAVLFFPERIRDFWRVLPNWFKYGAAIFALISFLHLYKNISTYSLAEGARMFAYLTIPLFACVFSRELKNWLTRGLSLLWLLTLLQSLYENFVLGTDSLGGIPMNRNWNASLILVTLPFVFRLIVKKTESHCTRFCFLLTAALPSVYVIVLCNSLAAYLSVPAAVFIFLLFKRNSWKIFFAASFTAILLSVAAFFICKVHCKTFQDYLVQDDRVFLITACSKMVMDAPVSGYGIPSFEQEFLPYTRTADYFLRNHATDRQNHPHNHLLFIAAGVGLVGLAGWLLIWAVPAALYAFHRKKGLLQDEPLNELILFSWLLLAIHSMADLVLFQEPNNILGLLFTGLLWQAFFRREDKPADPTAATSETFRLLMRFCGYVVVGLALLMAACNLYASIHFRLSHRLWLNGEKEPARDHVRKMLFTAHWDNTNYYLYQSAEKLPPRDALRLLDRIAASPTPDFAHIHLIRGRLLWINGQQESAIDELQRDAELYPLHIEALYDLWMITLFTRNQMVAELLAGEINYRLEQRGLDARIRDPFPAPEKACISGPDAEKAETYDVKR